MFALGSCLCRNSLLVRYTVSITEFVCLTFAVPFSVFKWRHHFECVPLDGEKCHCHWGIQGGSQGRASPRGLKFFHFHAVFDKKNWHTYFACQYNICDGAFNGNKTVGNNGSYIQLQFQALFPIICEMSSFLLRLSHLKFIAGFYWHYTVAFSTKGNNSLKRLIASLHANNIGKQRQ